MKSCEAGKHMILHNCSFPCSQAGALSERLRRRTQDILLHTSDNGSSSHLEVHEG